MVNGSEDHVAVFLNVILNDLNCAVLTDTSAEDIKIPIITDALKLKALLQQVHTYYTVQRFLDVI